MAAPRVLVLSDPPGAPTGFGGQAELVARAVRAAGAEPVAVAMSGAATSAARRTFGDVRGWSVPYRPGPQILAEIVGAERPSAVVTLAELWACETIACLAADSRRRVLSWVAMDCAYLPQETAAMLAGFGATVAMSAYGERCLAPVAAAGGRVVAIPLAVRPEIAEPVGRDEVAARRRGHGIDDAFVALSVGRNQLRKGHPWLLDAWSRFVADLPRGARAILFLHTEQTPPPFAQVADRRIQAALDAQRGCDLPALLAKQFAGAADTVEFSDLGAPPGALRHLYATADVHVTATLAEGFGLPLAEAQACGRANIAPGHTTIPEIVGGPPSAARTCAPFGWIVPCDARVLQHDILEWRDVVDVRAMARCLREAWEAWRAGTLNDPAAETARREWTLARFGAGAVEQAWTALLRGVVGATV